MNPIAPMPVAPLVFFVPNLLKHPHACMKNELRVEIWDATPAASPPLQLSKTTAGAPARATSAAAPMSTRTALLGGSLAPTSSFGEKMPHGILLADSTPPIETATVGTDVSLTDDGITGYTTATATATATGVDGGRGSSKTVIAAATATAVAAGTGDAVVDPAPPAAPASPLREPDPINSSHNNAANGGFLGCLSLKRNALISFLHAGIGVSRTSVNYKKANDGTITVEPYTEAEIERCTLNERGFYGDMEKGRCMCVSVYTRVCADYSIKSLTLTYPPLLIRARRRVF